MRIVDLTQLTTEDMPVFPGTDPPKLEAVYTHEEHGAMVSCFTACSHAGTHIDAPCHMVQGTATLDNLPVSKFVGKALVIDAKDCKAGERITMDYVNKVKDKADQAEILLFRTDWDKNWNDKEKYLGDYPYIDDDVAQYIIDSKKKCVGFDVLGIDPIADENYTLHKKLFNAGVLIVENLTNLELCGDGIFLFSALPVKYKNADGAPVRAVGFLDLI